MRNRIPSVLWTATIVALVTPMGARGQGSQADTARADSYDITLAGEPERHAENNPETRGSIELAVPLPLGLRAAANSRYTGTQYCLNGDTGSEMELDSQVEHDVVLERSFNMPGRGVFRSLRTLLAFDNVTDATVYDQCGLPQPGRTLRFMFTLR